VTAATLQRSYLEVDLGMIAANAGAIRRNLPGVKVWAVGKADGYGCGLVPIARAAVHGGAYGIVVDSVAEVRTLRAACVQVPLLCLNAPLRLVDGGDADPATAYAVRSKDDLDRLIAAAGKLGKRLAVHLEIDTGMGRSGLLPQEVGAVTEYLDRQRGIVLAGVMTHLAAANDASAARRQLAQFADLTRGMAANVMRHVSATGGLLLGPDFSFDAVRVGLGLYGLVQGKIASALGVSLAVCWTTQVVQIYLRPLESTVGYGCAHPLRRDSRLGLISVGFADGYPRLSQGVVAVHGTLIPIVGGVNMTNMVIDLTDRPDIQIGDTVSLLAADGPRIDDLLSAGVPAQLPNSFVCGRTNNVAVRYKNKMAVSHNALMTG
jgi:alanine racemase